MLDCTTDRYGDLYAPWLEKPGDLLDLAGYQPGMKLLDLCGGTGVVTKEAFQRGAPTESLTLHDLNPRLTGYATREVRQVGGRAENINRTLWADLGTYDIVVCRQAIAYIDLFPTDMSAPGRGFHLGVCRLLKPGGKFVFNSFIRPRWAFKSYQHQGLPYVEASGWLWKWVLHLQWQRGPSGGFDVSLFRWHREADLLKKFSPLFDVVVHRSERGLRWVCTKK